MALDPTHLRAAAAHLRRQDPVLAEIIRGVGPCRLRADRKTPPFAALVESILHQQITGRAAATIHGRLCALVGRPQPRAEDFHGATDEALRACGLSRQKIRYLRDLVSQVQDGLPLGRLSRLSDDAVVEALTSVKGIGRWTAEMYLMFRLGRPDVLPVTDYGIQKAMQRAYGWRSLPKPERMRRTAEAWRPYRTVACWYLWRTLD
jgi:3-methyladenine DNA glycosylase/8-oxoguanine DNA glycosylase